MYASARRPDLAVPFAYELIATMLLTGGRPSEVTALTAGRREPVPRSGDHSRHGGDALVRRVYGHLGTVRHRSASVEFRVEQHRITLRKHIARLNWGRLPFERQPKVEQENRRIA